MLRLVASLARITLAVVRSVALESAAMSSVSDLTARLRAAAIRVGERLAIPPAEIVTTSELAELRSVVESVEWLAGATGTAPAPIDPTGSVGAVGPVAPSDHVHPYPGAGQVVDGGAVVPAAQPGPYSE